jgi:hypothetical protein
MPKVGIGAPAPRLQQKQRPKPREAVTFKYRRQFAVVVACDDEKAQQEIYARLHRSGYRCKVVCV